MATISEQLQGANQLAFLRSRTGDPGMGLYDEVVSLPEPVKYYKYQAGPGTPSAAMERKNAPPGYSLDEIDVVSTMTINPGEAMLFSVPFNHVSQRWYLRVKFALELPQKTSRPQPYTFADFSWVDIPKEYRAD